jgi:hypothetical protein
MNPKSSMKVLCSARKRPLKEKLPRAAAEKQVRLTGISAREQRRWYQAFSGTIKPPAQPVVLDFGV